jgi:hypothetical protein
MAWSSGATGLPPRDWASDIERKGSDDYRRELAIGEKATSSISPRKTVVEELFDNSKSGRSGVRNDFR